MECKKVLNCCTYQDNFDHIPGLKILLLSLNRYQPNCKLNLVVPGAPKGFLQWTKDLTNVIIRSDLKAHLGGWNIKPSLLLQLLKEGNEEVVWIDADIVLTAPVMPLISKASPNAIIATEEYYWEQKPGTKYRTPAWGLKHARPLAMTVNTCFLRVTQVHIPFLEEWDKLMHREEYIEAQKIYWNKRPIHMIGDQDVFTALIGSEKYKDYPLYLLKNGEDIAQCFWEDGYTVLDRFRHAKNKSLPPIIHAQGQKPWRKTKRKVYLQLSPYQVVAEQYREYLKEPTSWLELESPLAKLLDWVFRRNPNTRGILHAFLKTNFRFLKNFTNSLIRFLQL